MITNQLNLSMSNPKIVQAFAKQGDKGRIYKINLDDATEENGTMRIKRVDGEEYTSPALSTVSPTITDGMATFDSLEEAEVTELEIKLEPKQDLHGYANPWPSGGGKNKFNIFALESVSDTSGIGSYLTQNNDGSITVHNTTQANVKSNKKLSELADLVVGESYRLTVTTTGDANYIYLHTSAYTWHFGDAHTVTQNDLDSIVSFYPSGANNRTATLSDIMIRLSSITDGTFAPYSNICPITGRTGANAYRAGKNLFGYSLPIHKGYWSSTSFVGDDSVVSLENATGWTNIRVPVPDGVTITISGMQARSGVYAAWLGSDNPTDVVSRFANYSMNGTKTVPSGARYLGICFNELSTAYTDYPNAQVNIGSTATAYEPYNGTTYPLSLGQSVYGGTLDVVSGKLTVTYAYEVLDNPSKWETATGTTQYRYTTLYTDRKLYDNSFTGLSCTALQVKSGEALTGRWQGATSFTFGIADANNVLSLDTVKAMSASGSIAIKYELATPIEVDLTPTQISTLLGENNVWSDGEITELTFEYDGLLAELPQDATEIVGNQIGDVDFNGASTMPFILTIKKNHEVTT